ncbi:hypothetical protein DFH07DRAFT_401642 [Mycena maculata]|uniref:Uncharacterized protein n=1 Tax=Mycena maculata TaxID=230809 RepID=A0AAD7JFL5_9AGAR|nr:hypothetical protein DFH07DRAFT_401642 [Mycena maculata]
MLTQSVGIISWSCFRSRILESPVCSSPVTRAVRTLWIVTRAPLAVERVLIPEIIQPCVNLGSLSCKVGALEALSDAPFPPHFQLTLFEQMVDSLFAPRPHWPRILEWRHLSRNLTDLHLSSRFTTFFPVAHLPNLISRLGSGGTLNCEAVSEKYGASRTLSTASRFN